MLLFRENPPTIPHHMAYKDQLTQPLSHGHIGGSFFDNSEKIIRHKILDLGQP